MKALYTGSFDPFTRGHLDIVRRTRGIFANVTVGVGENPAKKYLFDRNERIKLVRETIAFAQLGDVDVVPVDGLTVDFAKLHGFTHLVKGARNSQDFDYERLLHDISLTQQFGTETVLLFADSKLNNVSSSATKELARHQGLIHEFVTLNVKAEIEKKLGQRIIGVTGTIGSGKSTLCRTLVSKFPDAHHVNFDELGRQVLEGDTALARKTQAQIEAHFGTKDRKKLGQIIFGDAAQLKILNEISREPLLTLLRLDLAKRRGIIFLEGALLAEFNWLHLCCNRVILVQEPEDTAHVQRLLARGLDQRQIATRRFSQYSFERKKSAIEAAIAHDGYGRLIVHHSENKGAEIDPILDSVAQAFLKAEG